MLTLYAQPYDITATGFVFGDAETFEREAAKKTNSYGQPVEEFEIQVIDGDPLNIELANAAQVHQGDVSTIFEAIDWLEDHQKIVAILALREGLTFDLADDDPDELDIQIYAVESMRDLAIEFVDEGLFGDIPEQLTHYIDYDAMARDLAMDYSEITIAGERLIFRAG